MIIAWYLINAERKVIDIVNSICVYVVVANIWVKSEALSSVWPTDGIFFGSPQKGL